MKDTDSVKTSYLDSLLKVLEMPDSEEKKNNFMNLYTTYAKYCYSHDISTYDYNFYNKAGDYLIIDVDCSQYTVDLADKELALGHLEQVLANIENGELDGISEEEVQIILQSLVENARIGIEKYYNLDINKSSLQGTCGIGQALTAYPLKSIGIETSYNQATLLPDNKTNHAYITCFFPVKEGSSVISKQYLIDVTYKQFFSALRCNEGCFYNAANNSKNKVGADPGYYLCDSKEGMDFARTLISQGYIELTEENAYLYGYGFSCTSIHLDTSNDDIKRIVSHSGREYIESMKQKTVELDIEYEKLIEDGFNLDLHVDIKKLRNNYKGRR